MEITCPKCHEIIIVPVGGRPKLDMPVIKVCGALADSSSTQAAADLLGVSRGYIYKVLRNAGKKPRDYLKGVHSQ